MLSDMLVKKEESVKEDALAESKEGHEGLNASLVRRSLSSLDRKQSPRRSLKIRFNEQIEEADAIVYDRWIKKPWLLMRGERLITAYRELNQFKRYEMEVHNDSKHFTKFHRECICGRHWDRYDCRIEFPIED